MNKREPFFLSFPLFFNVMNAFNKQLNQTSILKPLQQAWRKRIQSEKASFQIKKQYPWKDVKIPIKWVVLFSSLEETWQNIVILIRFVLRKIGVDLAVLSDILQRTIAYKDVDKIVFDECQNLPFLFIIFTLHFSFKKININ